MQTKLPARPCGGKGLPDNGKAYAALWRVLKGMTKRSSKDMRPGYCKTSIEQL